ncbi:hydrolase [Flavobacterium beibuense F44-8]|uniref:Hydrolase n=1 Tax=Flavobacterium beibuense F44-8 TaxID=1406840 RepID=A0A0A2LSB6_9FLAO|nr:amidohydrolase [Flavobacterium beibuense]KGO79090.1 hydrolase [Flavobacterium beibuense F44-8]
MKQLTYPIAVLLVLLTCIVSCNKKTTEGDSANQATIYYGGDILTMEGDAPVYAEAIVSQNGKIVFVGAKQEALDKYKENDTEIDLKGKTLVPAFLDGHGHFFNVGFTSMCANILPAPDGPGTCFDSIVNTLNKYKDTEDGKYIIKKTEWIIGNGYDDSQLKELDHPTATDLDKVSTDVPVLIIHQSGHLGVLNSKGLELAGYTKDNHKVDGGVVRLDENGNPTGVLEEGALFKVLFPILGKMDDEMSAKCIKKGQDEYAKMGYLTAQDGRTTLEQLASLKKGADENQYYLDVVAYPDIRLGLDSTSMDSYYTHDHTYKNRFRIGGAKLTLDGSPQGRTAWLTQCYHTNPTGIQGCYKGYEIIDNDEATEYVKEAYKNKWQLLCHTNGDAAIDQYLNAIDEAQKTLNYNDHRTVMIHGQNLRKDQIPELVRLNIMPSLFPMHTYYWGDWHVQAIFGPKRGNYISPCRDVIDAGLKITSHHDAPVTFPNSMRVLDATVNRISRNKNTIGADQRISPYEGLKTLTDWAAYQYFEEDSKGTLTVGKLADFVILDQNPVTIEDTYKIFEIKILESIKEGKTVYKSTDSKQN